MFQQLLLGVLLLMAEQVGVQSGARIGVHSHLNVNQGGLLNLYSPFAGFRRPYRTGALAVSCTNNAQKSYAGGGTVLMKEIRINTAQAGNYRIYWQMKNSDNITTVSVWFFVNGIAISPNYDEATNVYTAKTYNYDVNLNAGDLLQLYGFANGDTVWIINFRISYDWRIEHFSDGTTRVLVTALPLTDLTLLDFTNTLV
jgi:hypothetical protein